MKIKKLIKTAILLFIILFLCSLARYCGRDSGTFAPLELWFEEKSPDKLYAIACSKYIKAPPYSKQMVQVIIKEIDKDSVIYGDIKIDNNGKKLDESNYEIEWTATGAILTLKGLRQSPISYVIEWKKSFLDFDAEIKYWEGKD